MNLHTLLRKMNLHGSQQGVVTCNANGGYMLLLCKTEFHLRLRNWSNRILILEATKVLIRWQHKDGLQVCLDIS
ncbi:hypothetical protein HanPSC8_Chr13g0547511 [Helianthus annuus]|nr:hypothetical protein HanPSC8_Chr13g0547511 [Helianthus annuus]